MKEKIKSIQKIIGTTADGIIGPKTISRLCAKLGISSGVLDKDSIKNIQKAVGVVADGIIGIKTVSAILDKLEPETKTPENNSNSLEKFYINKPVEFSTINYKANPVKQSILRKGTSIYGKAGNESNLVTVKVPENYPLKYDGKKVKSIRVHKLAADRLEAALKDIINHYGDDIEKVAPGACIYDGSYNFRSTRNGSSQSVHSWGLAIDFDAAHNGLKTPWKNARFSQPIYKPFLDILEHHGWLSLGRRDGRDGMHVQMTLWG